MNRQSGPKISFSIADLPLNITFRSLFEFARRHKVDGVEIVLGYKTFPGAKTLEKLSREYNVPILSIHQPLSAGKLLFPDEKVFDIAHYFQAKLTIHPNRSHSTTSPQQQSYLSRMAALQSRYNVEVLLENLPQKSTLPLYKFSRIEPSNTNITNIYNLSKKYHFGITFDTSHFSTANIHRSAEFRDTIPIIQNIHLSDFNEREQHLVLGGGLLKTKEFLQLLKRHKFNKLITIELTPHMYYKPDKYLNDLLTSINIVRYEFNDSENLR